MSQELVKVLNVLLSAIELAQSKGCYSLTESKLICENVEKLKEILNPPKQQSQKLDTVIEDSDEVINI